MCNISRKLQFLSSPTEMGKNALKAKYILGDRYLLLKNQINVWFVGQDFF